MTGQGAIQTPPIKLKGGPYDGEAATAGDPDLRVAFFPESLTVLGPEGSAVYTLDEPSKRSKTRTATYSHMG